MTRPAPRHLRAVAAMLTLLAVALAPSAAEARATPDGPDYGSPQVGECHQLTMDDAASASDTSAPTDCAQSHTTRVIAVGHLPTRYAWSNQDAVERVAIRACVPALDEALGRTDRVRDVSAYSWLYFRPTRAQRDHGARWIRCDLLLLGGARLLRLPTDTTPALGRSPLPNGVARCLTGRTFSTTACSRSHAFRATGTFTVDAATYPGARRLDRAAARRCPSHVSSTAFRWTYRTGLRWNLGDHVVVCYTRTGD